MPVNSATPGKVILQSLRNYHIAKNIFNKTYIFERECKTTISFPYIEKKKPHNTVTSTKESKTHSLFLTKGIKQKLTRTTFPLIKKIKK